MTQRLFATILGAALAAFGPLPSPASAADADVARGRYLVTISGCSDCHTPGALLGAPDMKRYLGGSDVGFAIPGAGVFVGENSDARQGDRPRRVDGRADHRRDPHRQNTRGKGA